VITGGLAALGAVAAPRRAWAATPRVAPSRVVDVRNFGAAGDGRTDDTRAFRRALEAASDAGVVGVPRGDYLLRDTLEVPPHVMIEGSFRAPSARGQRQGSTLLYAGPGGNPDGAPLIALHEEAGLRGLAVLYPEQRRDAAPIPYPWTVRASGDNCALLDLLLVNPYQAVDLGTHAAGRHWVRGLYGQPLYRGLYVDQCYDVGRIESVHFWPFWEAENPALLGFVREHGEAFVLGRCDWEYLDDCFCLGYRVGYHFVATGHGSPNALLTQCGSDLGPTAVRVESCQTHAGVSFVNGQFMAGVEVAASNAGPLKFTACGFWGVETTDTHVILEGRGHTTLLGCHFTDWGRRDAAAPAIDHRSGGLSVNACDFAAEERAQIRVARDVDAAVIVGNRFRGQERVLNEARERAQIGLNAVSPPRPRADQESPARESRILERGHWPRWRA